jgi:hypothetical protein
MGNEDASISCSLLLMGAKRYSIEPVVCGFLNYHIVMLVLFGCCFGMSAIVFVCRIFSYSASNSVYSHDAGFSYSYDDATDSERMRDIKSTAWYTFFFISLALGFELLPLPLVCYFLHNNNSLARCWGSCWRPSLNAVHSDVSTAVAGEGSSFSLRIDLDNHATREPDSIICVICLSCEGAMIAAPCGHLFHDACIRKWVRAVPSCPSCRCICSEACLLTVE